MLRQGFAALAASAFLFVTSVSLADDHPYSEGPVINVASIRTAEGKFDEYMDWLSTTWKKLQEESKKKGYIVSYEILSTEPRGPNDPDIFLVVTYKNWAVFDGLGSKLDKVSADVEGSVEKADQAEAARVKIRTVIGSETMQEAVLK